ncbi:hypothetical protein GUJ93_ZPchr0303g11317 [Zizania palustris]|uniref:Uncharacterized protein n=1 Tax=Zizania palustris TaxID=103762 RepID=A0A8J5VE92_ZIZPA|nr:hypothetical protein GUJ93_ZPchr0303g11317 [Zizania palustris]
MAAAAASWQWSRAAQVLRRVRKYNQKSNRLLETGGYGMQGKNTTRAQLARCQHLRTEVKRGDNKIFGAVLSKKTDDQPIEGLFNRATTTATARKDSMWGTMGTKTRFIHGTIF